ncbi:hypothetical protein CH75_05735 [Dyella jiangningensis]|nr:hypothetical protein CH75_05735 [Dyella jiangningensis]
MLAFCALAALAWKGSPNSKWIAFVTLAVLTFGSAYTPIKIFPIFIPTFWLAFAVPLIGLVVASVRLSGWRRWSIFFPSLLLLGGVLLVTAAVVASSAFNPSDGVVNVGIYIKAKSAVRARLDVPDSAKFRMLRISTHHGQRFVCGEVSSKNLKGGGLAGYTRFYLPTDAVAPLPTFEKDDEASRFEVTQACTDDYLREKIRIK